MFATAVLRAPHSSKGLIFLAVLGPPVLYGIHYLDGLVLPKELACGVLFIYSAELSLAHQGHVVLLRFTCVACIHISACLIIITLISRVHFDHALVCS